MKQLSFASVTYAHKKVITKREKFLRKMDQVIPWQRWLDIVAPYYPKAGNGRPPMPMEVMLRIYWLQQWYALSDPGAEEALYDIECMRNFAKLELGEDPIPDETTILNFRRLIEAHKLSDVLFSSVAELSEV